MITEMTQDKSTGRFVVGGDFLDIDIPNQDGLTFSGATIDWLLNDETFKDCLARRVYPAYIEHPTDNTPGFRKTEAGFLIDCHREGNKLKGKIELLDSTEEGRYIKDCIYTALNLVLAFVQMDVPIPAQYQDEQQVQSNSLGLTL